jgi:oxygen-dependent protoporphyrinogen oxidase
MGGMKKPGIIKLTDSEITDLVLKETAELMGDSGKPDLLRIFRYTHAIPQYEKSTGERLEAIKKIEEEYPGLILAGNIRDGIGMADRVKQGKQIAELLISGNEK